jgi:tRNA(adenine34) deaminase
MDRDVAHMRHAVRLAQEALQAGNLPVGALVTLDGRVVSEGRNAISAPALDFSRHAEMESLKAVPPDLWPRSKEMTLYTTLEPCLMCVGAIIGHRIGRVVFGALDRNGGASCAFGRLSPFYEARLRALEWIGPVLPEVCDELYELAVKRLAEYRHHYWEE